MATRLLFVVQDGHGHVIPTLPLVSELVARGHRVEYATAREFADAVAGAGATWVELPGLPPFHPPAEIGPDVVALFFRHFFAALAATYPVLLDHCRAHRPDAVVYDTTNWPARLVARGLGVPAVRTVPNLAENESWTGVGDAMTEGTEDHPATAALADDVAAFAAEHDVELDVPATMDVTEDLNLVFVPRAFQPGGAGFDARFRFLGPLLGDRERAQAWTPPHPDRPLLYISLGSIFTDMPAFYRACVDAFGDGRYQVAMTIGDVDPAGLGPLPATIEARRWFPQPAVLRWASAFVTHAGMNSTMEAVAYGVPMLALPRMPEQALNADRLTELGLGVRLDPADLSAATLRAAVDAVVADPDVRAALARMRAAAHDGGGAGTGADAIEQHLAATPAPRR